MAAQLHVTPSFLSPKPAQKPATRIRSFPSFLDLTPTSRPEPLTGLDLRYHDGTRSKPDSYDAAVIGCGPSGLRLAEQAAARGIRVCCIDPDPLAGWPNNYGSWVDEFEEMGLEDCLDHTWALTSVVIDDGRTKLLDRPYGRVARGRLKRRLMEGCVDNGVSFVKARAWNMDHEEFKSTINCSDGSTITASLVVDASGFNTPFIHYTDKRRDHGYQIAHGILAEVDSHPFDLDKMLLMDWRDSHLDNEPYLRPNNSKIPTFLYVMPFTSNSIFLEETSLVSRPILSYTEIKRRMVARLRHLGINVKQVIEDEKCLIPMGGPLPHIPQEAVGMGGSAGLVHPSTGYMLSKALRLAPAVADEMAQCLGSTRVIRGSQLRARVWESLWTADRKMEREFYRFGMETLLKLDLDGTRRFFDAFFDLEPHYWQGFLSSRLSLKELALLSLKLYGNASNPSKMDIVTKCPAPLAKMVRNLALQAAQM